jgi:hypothetical protein
VRGEVAWTEQKLTEMELDVWVSEIFTNELHQHLQAFSRSEATLQDPAIWEVNSRYTLQSEVLYHVRPPTTRGSDQITFSYFSSLISSLTALMALVISGASDADLSRFHSNME